MGEIHDMLLRDLNNAIMMPFYGHSQDKLRYIVQFH